jgi:thiol-disulfide isomerase/thioredoxin
VASALWQAGSATYIYLIPNVKDWFIMGEGKPNEAEIKITASLPRQISAMARQLASQPTLGHTPLLQQGISIPATKLSTLTRLTAPRQAPPLNLTNHHGQTMDINPLKGKTVLVNFWATWCPPCVEEIPSLNRLQAHYEKRDLEIISVDFRESAQVIGDFHRKHPVDFPVLMDSDGRTSLAWQVFSFPSSFIIDQEGQIRYSANRALNWDSKEVINIIDKLLAEHKKPSHPRN